MATSYEAVARSVVDRLIALIETDEAGTWTMPWQRLGNARHLNPINATTHTPYRGGNVVALAIAGIERGYRSATWATYKQWEANSSQVRRKERGTQLIRWITKTDTDATADTRGEPERRRMFPRVFYVFNADQCDHADGSSITEPEPVADFDIWIDRIGAEVVTGGDRAFYDPTTDRITMPPTQAFTTRNDYRVTLVHEHVHWTGHRSRLDRPGINNPTDPDLYAREELVAELGAAIACAAHGVEPTPTAGHAAYLAHWIRQLNEDPRTLFSAATAAQAALDHLNHRAGHDTGNELAAGTTGAQ